MTTFTIELDDRLAQRLEERARQLQMTTAEMAAIGLREFLEGASEEISDAEFEEVARRVIERDLELLQRLAK
jgi:predicted transcriptional regulator